VLDWFKLNGMSRESIRKRIDDLKEEADVILASNNLPKEVRLFISSMLVMMDIIVSALLTKKVRKNSSNSGLPPSQEFGSMGNRNRHQVSKNEPKGDQCPNTKETVEKERVTVDRCETCGLDLTSTECLCTETRKEIDVVYEIVTTEVTVETKECPECGKTTKASFPHGMDGELQYGIGVRAAIINYLFVQMMSLERIQEHFKGLIGRFISQATMLKYVFQFYQALEEWENRQLEKLLRKSVIHVDETSIRVNKVNYWIHVYTSEEISLQFVHEKRGAEAVDDINIIPRYGGTIVHDCWATYFSYDGVGHALCGSHLLRELKYIEECDHYGWAMMMKELLKEAAEVISARPEKPMLTKEEYKGLETRYKEILEDALHELPSFPKRQEGQRGKLKHTDAQNLWLRMREHEDSILMFARVKEVPFTNNRAERDIRCSKTKQKVSGGFRSLKFAECYVRIMSYVKSMRYRGHSSFQAINLALAGNIPKG